MALFTDHVKIISARVNTFLSSLLTDHPLYRRITKLLQLKKKTIYGFALTPPYICIANFLAMYSIINKCILLPKNVILTVRKFVFCIF